MRFRKIKPREVKSSKVKGAEEGVVTVVPGTRKDTIKVIWVCGNERTFGIAGLEAAIDCVDMYVAGSPLQEKLWMDITPLTLSGGERAAVRLVGGRMQADFDPREDSTAAWVSWFKLRQACRATIKDLMKSATKKGT